MEAFYKGILYYLRNFISQYSFFLNWDYYIRLFFKYFSFFGFITGFIFVLLVYFSNEKEKKGVGFLKVIPVIAVINSCIVLTNFFYDTFAQDTLVQGLYYNKLVAAINAPDNIISGLILTLVISSCYRGFGKGAFYFGIATHAALPLLNFSYLGHINDKSMIIYMIIRVILVGILCFILSNRKHFFTSWIWYFAFHMLLRVGTFWYPLFREQNDVQKIYNFKYIINETLEYVSLFTVDIVIFAIIFVFAIVFEKGVLTVRSA